MTAIGWSHQLKKCIDNRLINKSIHQYFAKLKKLALLFFHFKRKENHKLAKSKTVNITTTN